MGFRTPKGKLKLYDTSTSKGLTKQLIIDSPYSIVVHKRQMFAKYCLLMVLLSSSKHSFDKGKLVSFCFCLKRSPRYLKYPHSSPFCPYKQADWWWLFDTVPLLIYNSNFAFMQDQYIFFAGSSSKVLENMRLVKSDKIQTATQWKLWWLTMLTLQ